jgi:hypothetical protein
LGNGYGSNGVTELAHQLGDMDLMLTRTIRVRRSGARPEVRGVGPGAVVATVATTAVKPHQGVVDMVGRGQARRVVGISDRSCMAQETIGIILPA